MKYFIILLLLSSNVHSQMRLSPKFTKDEILNNIDSLHTYKMLPSLNLEAESFIYCRVHLFADNERWAVVFEEIKPGAGGDLTLYFFGNCLINQEKLGLHGQYLSNMAFVRLFKQDELKRIVVGK